MTITALDPATGRSGTSYEEMATKEAQTAVRAAHKAYLAWRRTAFADRADLLRAVGAILRRRAGDYAILMADEMGKPVTQGKAEAEKCAWVCDYYAEHGERFLSPEMVETEASRSYVAYRPLGVILAVMPWNFPFWQVLRFAAPAVMAGNAAVLKHASNVPGCALAIEEIFRDAGSPKDLFRTLLINNKQVGTIIRNKLVVGVTLTGSTGAGKAVAKRSGDALKKTVLELGGSDPYLILEDADVAQAAATCATSRLINSGQSCIAAKRFVVVESRRAEFERLLVEGMRRAKMGDPHDEATTLGPQARPDLRDDLHRQVAESVSKGAECLLGGTIPEGPGAFYPPTVLTGVRKGMPAYDQELFGPVAAVIPVKDEKAAIKVANDSVFGLGAAVFTRNLARGERIAAEELEAGACFVNALVKSDPRLPFGGVKESGYGRELSAHGIREFVNIKTVYVA